MSARRAGTTAVAAVVASALLVVVLVTWASSIGPSDVVRGEGSPPIASPTETEPSASDDAGTGGVGDNEPEQIERAAWVRIAATVIDIVMLVLLVVLLERFVIRPLVRRARTRRERRRRDPVRDADFTVLEPPQAVARALLAEAADQRRVLVEGDTPRNAVVECWHWFEVGAATVGVPRRPWETSSEYTIRMLDLVDAYQPAVTRLADLYREARFSEHELTEADRQDALEALDTIHRTIGVPT